MKVRINVNSLYINSWEKKEWGRKPSCPPIFLGNYTLSSVPRSLHQSLNFVPIH